MNELFRKIPQKKVSDRVFDQIRELISQLVDAIEKLKLMTGDEIGAVDQVGRLDWPWAKSHM